jgi:hypothetical protein
LPRTSHCEGTPSRGLGARSPGTPPRGRRGFWRGRRFCPPRCSIAAGKTNKMERIDTQHNQERKKGKRGGRRD